MNAIHVPTAARPLVSLMLAIWANVHIVGVFLNARIFRSRRRVPVILQLNATECGPACLAMVLGFYGRATRVAEVREMTGVGRTASAPVPWCRRPRRTGCE